MTIFPYHVDRNDNCSVLSSLSDANTDVRNLQEENRILRANLKEYQRSLDESESQRLQTPQNSPSRTSRFSVKKKINKKNISSPDKFLHVSGAKMVDCKMTIIDNTGMLDPRVRKFLHLAGIDPDTLLRKLSKKCSLLL